MQLKVKKLHPDARLPTYATPGSACFDLYAVDNIETDHPDVAEFRTGLAFEVPEGFVMMIYSRSGHGFKHNVRLSNCVGVIDSDYRGEVKVKLTCDVHTDPITLTVGDRIAQAMLIPVTAITFEEVSELSQTSRGTWGLGSTGQ